MRQKITAATIALLLVGAGVSLTSTGAAVQASGFSADDVTIESNQNELFVEPSLTVEWENVEPSHVGFIVLVDGEVVGSYVQQANTTSFTLPDYSLFNVTSNETHELTIKTAVFDEPNGTVVDNASFGDQAVATTSVSDSFNVTVLTNESSSDDGTSDGSSGGDDTTETPSDSADVMASGVANTDTR